MKSDLIIIGAGPYALALASHCKQIGLPYRAFGESMAFWKRSMPRGMLLRSRCDWHLDPLERLTLQAYFEQSGIDAAAMEPIPLERYLAYARWFQQKRQIEFDSRLVSSLRTGTGSARFSLTLADGEVLAADHVVVTTGFGACAYVPEELAALLPPGRWQHSRDCVEPERLAGRTCLIVGGRQSAFELAALGAEAGARHIHVAYRHATPDFAAADWSWVNPILDRSVDNPGWYRRLDRSQREAIVRHMWSIGRQQLEPWLGSRIANAAVTLWPGRRIASCRPAGDGQMEIEFDDQQCVRVDDVVLATGYRMNLERLDFLRHGDLLQSIGVTGGEPDLDDVFQSSLPGLFFVNKFASKDFGNFFDFTAGARAAARIICNYLVTGRVPGAEQGSGDSDNATELVNGGQLDKSEQLPV